MTGARRAAAAGLTVLAVAGVAAGTWLLARPDRETAPPVYFDAPDFALLDQRGDTLRSSQLRGTVWVASFIFTNCASVCPLITARMAELRDELAARGLLGTEVRLVSITVDPARDTVSALAAYAARFGASPPSEWAFLTGSPPEAVRRLVQEGFKVTAILPPAAVEAGGNYQVSHSPRIELVDREGRVRGAYEATDPEALDRLSADLARLLE